MSLYASASTSGVSITAGQANASWLKAHYQTFSNPAPQTLISQGQPAYIQGSGADASNAVTSNYQQYVDLSTPSSSNPDALAVDL